ncbi:sugar ABC transporter ATP-binding protein [Spirosoma oryzicola]|uniref:sugar ABC transporter ATP-binding protein n=1 Tax=Spirosoma oryzicola TaxID=2898794 RepID=UPI001E299CEB|nr:sugar ABC transporter ATP-binding protein [Spirosoma oryzicola]UHG93078.1 sugar ABC transporter ATP-binding protein [Spirosoma oryzicola]
MVQLRHISKHFPGVKALNDVSLYIRAGEIHALCGENGAGKSTLMNILTGNLRPDAGQILLRDQPVQITGPAEATRLGLAIVYQQLSLIDSLTVAENIFANRQPYNRFGLIQYNALYEQTQQLLNQLVLNDIRPQARVADLSPGQKQMVEIAKALSQNPEILLLDEPTASLTERETATLFALIRQLRAQGKAIVYISHRLTEIFALADCVSVLKDGTYQGTERIKDVTPDWLINRMVGREITAEQNTSSATNDVLLQVENLGGLRFQGVSFQLHRGEILGLAGLVGAGRTEIARAIFGIDKQRSGIVRLNGEVVQIDHPDDAVRLGIGYLPEERKRLGLFMEQSVAQNIVAVRPPVAGPWFRAGRVKALAESFRLQLGIRTPSVNVRVENLSGGNQQKTMLARWLLANPDLLLVDEPTHGIDVGGKAEIYTLLRQLAAKGKGILLISSELPELLALSDRILVVRDGQLSGELSRSEATEEKIMALATD